MLDFAQAAGRAVLKGATRIERRTPRWRLASAWRVAALAVVAIALIAGAFSAEPAHARPLLEAETFCEPGSVRPGVPVLISCTLRLTNAGDETATNLAVRIGSAAGCAIPDRFVFIDRTVDGELLPQGPVQLSFDLDDLAPGETLEATSRLVATNISAGPTGGFATVVSEADPSASVSADACWSVSEDAAAPASHLQVTKTLLPALPSPEPPPPAVTGGAEPLPPPPPPLESEPPPLPLEPPPPPPPEDGAPVPIEGSPVAPSPDEAQFEILVTNASDRTMTDVRVLEVQTGNAVFVSGEPPPSGFDPLGRPTWELSAFDLPSLGPGEELRILATSAPSRDATCSFADDLVIVTATPLGGDPETYSAFADAGSPVGPCDVVQNLCWHYPPEGEPVIASCDAEVCWAESPEGAEFSPITDDCETEYCWSIPPGEGEPQLSPCAEPVCWSPSPGGDLLSPDSCEVQSCQFTAPDASRSLQDSCDISICWSVPAGSSEWRPLFDCDGLEASCWFSPPGDGEPALRSCAQEICWLSSSGGDVKLFTDVPCDIEFCQFTAPDGSTSVQEACAFPVCWSVPAGGAEWQPVFGCSDGEIVEGTVEPLALPPSSEVAPVEIVEGTVESIEPLASAEVIPAELIRTERVEPGLDATEEPAPPAIALPEVGASAAGGSHRPWALTAALAASGLLLAALGVRIRGARHL